MLTFLAKPDKRRCKAQKAKIALSKLVKTREDSAIVFDLVDETLNQMSLPVETGIVVAVIDPVLATGNDGDSACRFDEFEQMIGVISSISDDKVAVMTSKQFSCLSYVVSLSASQHDGERIA